MTGFAGLASNRYYFEDIPDQSGRTALVTGGSAGIGANIACGLALAGATVHILSHTPEHGEETKKAIEEEMAKKNATGSVIYHRVPLENLNEVKKFAEVMKEKCAVDKATSKGGLDYLINNAGIGVAKYQLTDDGLACHFGVNHLSHMLLTHILLPLLEDTAELPRNAGKKGSVRVVMQASQQHKLCPSDVKFEDLEECNKDIGGNGNYARSKLMNILYAKELSIRKLMPAPISSKIVVISVHPGAVATDQEKAAQEPYGLLGTALVAASRVLFMSPEQGSENALWAATSPKLLGEDAEKYQGAYLTQPDDSLGNETNQAKDSELAKRLWTISVQVLKDKTGVVIDY